MKDFWNRLLAFEPTMVRAVLTALVVAAGAFGLDLADVTGRVDVAWTALFAIIPILQGLVTRPAVTPNLVAESTAGPEGAPEEYDTMHEGAEGDDYRDWLDN